MARPPKPINITKPTLVSYINGLLSPGDVILDIGCGTKEISKELKCAQVITLDVWKPFNPDIWCDLTQIAQLPCADNTFQVVLLIDVIEHLPKNKGFKVLEDAKRVTSKYIVLLTPLWWDENVQHFQDPASPYFQNQFDKHLSLWTPEDLPGFEQITRFDVFYNYFLGVWRKNDAN